MEGKKQTAVEWLRSKMFIECLDNSYELFEQAKQMEREQIMQGFGEGLIYDKKSMYTPSEEQYYNKTYEK
jgi:hypothetical protein